MLVDNAKVLRGATRELSELWVYRLSPVNANILFWGVSNDHFALMRPKLLATLTCEVENRTTIG